MKLRTAVLTVTAVAALTACGGNEPVDGNAGGTPGRTGTSPQTTTSRPKPRFSVPKGYDTSKGWIAERGDPLVMPHTKAVAFAVAQRSFQVGLTAMDVTTGKALWTSDQVSPGSEEFHFRYLAASVGGKDYLVAYAAGKVGADVVNKGKDVLKIYIYSGQNSGDRVKPLHQLEIEGDGFVTDAGGGLLVEMEDDSLYSVDPVAGTTKPLVLDALPAPAGCAGCGKAKEVIAVTTGGPVVRSGSGLWVPGGWSSADIQAPTPVTGAFARLIEENALLVEWNAAGSADKTSAVVDSTTGKVRAITQCRDSYMSVSGEDNARLSANGRYAIHGGTVFDLEKGTGHCFEESKSTKALTMTGVTDNGIAFATDARGDKTSASIKIDIATGKAQPGESGIAPVDEVAGMGVFTEEKYARSTWFYPRAA